jgi:acetyl-CoA C-acetyltransferase
MGRTSKAGLRRVRMVGAATSKYGKMEETMRESASSTALACLNRAQIDPSVIEEIYVANAFGLAEPQGHLGPLIATSLGLPNAATLTIESACASGGVALHQAYVSVASGQVDAALVVGVEKVSHLDTRVATTYFSYGSDVKFEAGSGGTFPGLYATLATAYLNKYGATEEQLAHVAVKNHKNALANPNAHLHKAISVEQVLQSPYVAWPLKFFDCCPFSDGSAAVVLVAEAVAKSWGVDGIEILGSGRGGSAAQLSTRNSLVEIPGTKQAAAQAFAQAGLEPKDVDFAEVHDCFTIAEALAVEDLGFVKKGQGAKAAQDGLTTLSGDLPVNPSGGLKAKGHPVGTTGVGQAVEIFEQLDGRAGARQVKGAEVGLTHNIGATGGSCAVHLFGRV